MQPTDQLVLSSFNPFAMMIDPDAVLQAVGRSDRLAGLECRVCRPLDKLADAAALPAHVLAFDRMIDSQGDLAE